MSRHEDELNGVSMRKVAGKFRDRGEIMKALFFPENSPNLVVIPSNEKGTGFLRTCYDKDILKDIMTKDEFQGIVDGASKVVAKVYSKKRLADTAGISNYITWLSLLAVVLAILFLAMIYVAIDIESLFLEMAAYCIIFASMMIIIVLSVNECFRDSTKKFIRFNKAVKEQLDLYFDKVNQ